MKHYTEIPIKEHIVRHEKLYHTLDELLADFIDKTGKLPSDTTLLEFVKWSHQQTIYPEIKHKST